jgi:hypothetical protein
MINSNQLPTTTTRPSLHVPRAPRSVRAVPANGRAVVRWGAPSDNNGGPGSAVTGYVVTPYRHGVALSARVFSSRKTSQVVSGLKNHKAYTFRVAARNVVGTGARSAASAPVLIGVPTAPTGVHADGRVGKAVVRWRRPASNGGSAIRGYVVTPYLGGSARPAQRFRSTATSQTVTGLASGRSYTFRVVAFSEIGDGRKSSPSPPALIHAG